MGPERGADRGTEQVLAVGGLIVDLAARQVSLDGSPVDVTRSEFALLVALARVPGTAISDRDLLGAIWGVDWHGDTSALQVHLSRLRRKLGESGRNPGYLRTVRGFGYRLDARGGTRSSGTERSEPGSSLEPATEIALAFDRDMVLLAVIPHEPFLGWDPDRIVGGFFSPVGLDRSSIALLADGYLAVGVDTIEDQLPMRSADGSTVVVPSRIRLLRDGEGRLDGVHAILRLPR